MSNFMNRIFAAAVTFAVVAVGCSDNSISDSQTTTSEKITNVSSADTAETSETTENVTEKNSQNIPVTKTSESELFSDRDLNPDYSEITAEVSLNGNSVGITGNGVSVNGSAVTISGEGIYHITGTLNDGQIIVDADKNKVQLVLDNASISCSNAPAIYVKSAKKVFITLADGSKNYVSDGADYSVTDSTDNPDSAIFSHDSLTINGSGELDVAGNYNDGIRSKDDIVITGGKITVNAVGDAIKGKDYVAVADGVLDLTAGQNGINASNKTDAEMGFVYIEGGDFNITSGGGSSASTKTHNDDFGGFGHGGGFGRGEKPSMPEGMEEPDFENFNPEHFDRGEKPTLPEGMEEYDFEDFQHEHFGRGERPEMPDGMEKPDFENFNPEDFGIPEPSQQESTENTDTVPTPKGIKAAADINITGGTFTINSADDAIHAGTEVNISGGMFAIDAGDDGINATSAININGGTVVISNSYEGLEASVINVTGGTVEVMSSDDGFNASDGVTDQSGMGTFSDALEINISGGTVYVSASGDGLDSNGNMTISGGTVIVNGCENGGNGALDSNGEINVNGGVLVAAGMSAMAESPADTSEQNSVSATFDTTLNGGTLVTLSDNDGNEIISFAPEKSFDNIVISSPDIQTGMTYTFYTGGTSSADQKYGLYENGGYNSDGTESGSFTADSVTSYVGKQTGGFGRGMKQPPDGMPDRKDFGQNKQAIF